MFVFSSVLIAATWFVARLGWDLARPTWRARPDRARRRFVAITVTGALVACTGFGAVIGALYGLVPGLGAAAVLLPVYVFMASVLRVLLRAFAEPAD